MISYFHWTEETVSHIFEHGVSTAEWEQAFENPLLITVSSKSGRPLRYGLTISGRCLLVIYEVDEGDECEWVTPITGYDSDRF